MDTVEKELSILVSEKEQADKLIGSYLELQVKVRTLIFTTGAVAAGWIFAQNKSDLSSVDVRGAAVLALAFLGSFSTLQGIVNYGIVLGYIRYKNLVVGRRMQDLLELKQNPLAALRAISSSSSNRIVVASSVFGDVFILGASGGLLVYALLLWREGKVTSSLFPGGLLACAILWLGTIISGLGLVRSMVVLRRETEFAKPQTAESQEQVANVDGFSRHRVREKQMHVTIPYAVVLIVAACFVAAWSFRLQSSGGDQFWGNLLLNLVAELAGIALGVVITLHLASKLAQKKLDTLALTMVHLIGQLRKDRTVSGEAARDLVVCGVALISEESLQPERSGKALAGATEECGVCGLSAETFSDGAGEVRCQHCKLRGAVWRGAVRQGAEPTAEHV